MKLFKNTILLLTCIFLTFSCVPRKKLIYLQPKQSSATERTFTYQDQEYVLKPKDVIALNIFSLTPGQFDFFSGATSAAGEEASRNNQFVIDKEGKVELPAIGKIDIAGQTIQQAQDNIRDMLEDYLDSPLVRITLQTPFIYSIVGEAVNPGRYVVIGRELNIIEAIANAGDLTSFADRSKVRLLRKENGILAVHEINLLEDNLMATDFYQLQSEDILVIDPLAARSFRENQLFVISSMLGAIGGLTILIRLLIAGK